MRDERFVLECCTKNRRLGRRLFRFIDAARLEVRRRRSTGSPCRNGRGRSFPSGHRDRRRRPLTCFADHVARRAVHAHIFSELEVFSRWWRALRGWQGPFPVLATSKPGIFRRGHGGEPCPAWPRPPSSFWWKSRLFLLPPGSCMRAATATCRGLDRAGSKHRKFLQHDFQLWIGLPHQVEHVRHGAFCSSR